MPECSELHPKSGVKCFRQVNHIGKHVTPGGRRWPVVASSPHPPCAAANPVSGDPCLWHSGHVGAHRDRTGARWQPTAPPQPSSPVGHLCGEGHPTLGTPCFRYDGHANDHLDPNGNLWPLASAAGTPTQAGVSYQQPEMWTASPNPFEYRDASYDRFKVLEAKLSLLEAKLHDPRFLYEQMLKAMDSASSDDVGGG